MLLYPWLHAACSVTPTLIPSSTLEVPRHVLLHCSRSSFLWFVCYTRINGRDVCWLLSNTFISDKSICYCYYFDVRDFVFSWEMIQDFRELPTGTQHRKVCCWLNSFLSGKTSVTAGPPQVSKPTLTPVEGPVFSFSTPSNICRPQEFTFVRLERYLFFLHSIHVFSP